MTLTSRLLDFINALGPDIKSLQSQITNHEQAMLPTSGKQINTPITSLGNTIASLSTGRLSLVRCPVRKGQQISGISFFSVGAAGTPTNQVFGLYNQDRTLIGTTPSDGATAWAANTRKRLALSTPYTPSADGWLYVGISVTATTVPTLVGIATVAQITALAPIMHGSSNSGLSNAASWPSTANALSALAGCPAVLLD